MPTKKRKLTPEEQAEFFKLLQEEKKKRGEKCIEEIAKVLKKYNCRQNVITHNNIDTGKTTADIEIIPN